MRVREIMTTAVVDVGPEASIHRAIQLMRTQKVSGLPVVDRDGELVGVLSEGDLLRRIELGTNPTLGVCSLGRSAEAYTLTHSRRVRDVMSKSPVTTTPDASLEEAVALMASRGVKRLPVMEAGRLVGIISRADFLRALAPIVAPDHEQPEVSDSDIERGILAELREEDWAAGTAITVAVKNGVVELQGAIVAETQRTAAKVLAENVNGVRFVRDALVRRDPAPTVA